MSKKAGEDYEITSWKQLLSDVGNNIIDLFSEFFNSYEISKKTWFVQSVNLILVFFFLYVASLPIFNKLREYFANWKSSAGFRLNLAVIAAILFCAPMITKNRIFRWQTIYKMNYKMSKQFSFVLIFANIGAYVLCYLNNITLSSTSTNVNTKQITK